tara:strand:- start:36 stop:386 length:351 start_codon:yes stop_codon:yes gene_type:complete
MSNPTPSPSKSQNAKLAMERRLASGEFGQPPNFNFERYNEAWAQLIENGPLTRYHSVCPLWIKEGMHDPSKKVVFECNKVREEVVIPAGVKVLVLKTAKKDSNSPDASVVYITEEY